MKGRAHEYFSTPDFCGRAVANALGFAITAAKRVNQIALTLSLAAMLFGVFWLVWILWETICLGLGGLSVALFTQTTPPNEVGGISNAIFGSVVMVLLATFVGTPIGIMAGIYLAEYESRSWLAATTRFCERHSAVCSLHRDRSVRLRRGGSPFKSFSGYAGVLALALIVIPVVIRTTENMLLLVPASLREAAYALAHPRRVITMVTERAARGWRDHRVLLAVARIAGETAPLLFTALNNQFWNADLSKPMASLPVTIFKFAMSPYENWWSWYGPACS